MTRGRGKKEAREAYTHSEGGKMPKMSSRAVTPKRSDTGIGPNRASGHKGGMGRQGSKRG